KIVARDGDSPLTGKIDYEVRQGGLKEIDKGSLELKDGEAEITSSRNDPGSLLLSVKLKPAGAEKEITGLGGAVFAPEKITASAPPPDDFDEFWKAKIAELHAVPVNVQVEKVDIGDPQIEYYKIALDNLRGAKIHGQIA